MTTFVLAGAGRASAKAAETLRAEGFDGRIVMAGDEAELPYDRPPLTKEALRGEKEFADAALQPAAFYEERDIELRLGTRISAVDPGAQEVELSGGERLRYDALLLATGASARRPPIPGIDAPHVTVLRSVADARRLRAALLEGGPLGVVGAGWLGSEAAASARQMGVAATLIDQAPAPLATVLGPRLGAWFERLHEQHGTRLHMGAGVAAIEAEGIRLQDGSHVEAAAVLVATGAAPNVALAEQAGIRCENGIVTDEFLRTSAPAVFAAGDVAAVWHPHYGRHVRVEHWASAGEQGAAAARSMLGAGAAYTARPYFFSDQYEMGLEYVGLHGPDDRLVVRGSLDDSSWQAFWVSPAGYVRAGMHVDDWDSIGGIRELVERDEVVDPAALGEPVTT